MICVDENFRILQDCQKLESCLYPSSFNDIYVHLHKSSWNNFMAFSKTFFMIYVSVMKRWKVFPFLCHTKINSFLWRSNKLFGVKKHFWGEHKAYSPALLRLGRSFRKAFNPAKLFLKPNESQGNLLIWWKSAYHMCQRKGRERNIESTRHQSLKSV